MQRSVKLQSSGTRPSLVILGAGYTAKALIPKLIARGIDVNATRRRDSPELRALGAQVLRFDGQASATLIQAIRRADYIVSCIAPNASGDPVLMALDIAALAERARWIAYLSATSVYGDRGGQWAFEDEPPRPLTARGRWRADAEIAWLETGRPVHIFRLAGIYGPGRSPFTKALNGTARAVIKPAHVVNRIHVDDSVRAILASLEAPNPQRIYNIADGHPASPQEVLDYAADLVGAARPPRVGPDDPHVSRMAKSFYAETKRIHIGRARAELGFTPEFKSYREGLIHVLREEAHSPVGVSLTGYIDISPHHLAAAQAALPEHIRATQAEDGCHVFRVTQDEHRATRYHVYERFTGPAAFKAHQLRAAATPWATATQTAARHYQIFGHS